MNANESEQKALLLTDGARQGDREKIANAVTDGVDIHFSDDEALYAASWRGRESAVRLLIEKGADARSRESRAAYLAAELGHRDIVELLVANGADNDALGILELVEQGFSLTCHKARVALMAALSAGSVSLVQVVIKHARCMFTFDDIAEAVVNAIHRKDEEMARYLIEAAAEVCGEPCLPPIIRAWHKSKAFKSILRSDSESKKVAVSILLESKLPLKAAAAEIGVTPRTLRRWKKQFAPDKPEFSEAPRAVKISAESSILQSEARAFYKQREVIKKIVERLCQ